MFVEINKQQLDDVHSLILKLAQKGVPITVVGLESDVKFLRTQLRDANEAAGWQIVTIEIH